MRVMLNGTIDAARGLNDISKNVLVAFVLIRMSSPVSDVVPIIVAPGTDDQPKTFGCSAESTMLDVIIFGSFSVEHGKNH